MLLSSQAIDKLVESITRNGKSANEKEIEFEKLLLNCFSSLKENMLIKIIHL